MLPVEFHDEADTEYSDAVDWYAARDFRLASAFAVEVRNIVDSISRDAGRFPTLAAERRYALLKRFPYILVYRFDDHRIQILAVAHVSRRPGYWNTRT